MTVRAAQIWEKERGLPIRRMPGGERPRVYADIGELEAWLQAEGGAPKDLGEGAGSGAGGARRPGRGLAWVVPLALVVGAVSVVAVSRGGLRRHDALPSLARCIVEKDVLRVEDEHGALLWQRWFPGLAPRAEANPAYPSCVITDVEGDGSQEVLLHRQPMPRLLGNGTLVLLESDGSIRWKYPFGGPLEFGGRLMPAIYAGQLVRITRVGGRPIIVSVAVHQPRFPSEIALIDAESGQAVERYRHPGYVYTVNLQDIDGDGEDELLFGAVNNPGDEIGHAVLGILDLPFGGPNGDRRIARDVFGEPGPRELLYLAFPRPAIFDAEDVPAYVAEIGVEDPRSAEVIVVGGGWRFYYRLDLCDLSAPRVIDVTVPQEVREAYRQAHARGLLASAEVDLDVASSVRVFDTAPAGCSKAFAGYAAPSPSPASSRPSEAMVRAEAE